MPKWSKNPEDVLSSNTLKNVLTDRTTKKHFPEVVEKIKKITNVLDEAIMDIADDLEKVDKVGEDFTKEFENKVIRAITETNVSAKKNTVDNSRVVPSVKSIESYCKKRMYSIKGHKAGLK